MARDGTTRERYRRDAERYGSDPADGERAVTGPPVPPPPGPGRRRTTGLREVPDAIRHMPATGCRWRAVPGRFPPSTTARDRFHPWRDSGVSGRMPGALRGPGRDPGGRPPGPTAGRSGRRGRPGPPDTTRTGGQGPRAERRGRCRGSPGRGPGAHGGHPGPGRRAGHRSRHAGQGAGGEEGVGRQRPRRRQAAGDARRDGCPGRAGDRVRTRWNRGFHGPVPPPGGAGDLRVDVAPPAAGEGLRAEPGELRGVGAAGRVPVPGPAAGAGRGWPGTGRISRTVTYDSNSKRQKAQ